MGSGLGSLTACLDRALRIIGGAPAYLLTDNAKTVTVEHVAGIPVRHPDMVALGRHYGCTVETCRPFDPESKGGTEATVKIAKADLVPAEANLRAEYASFAELEADCEAWCERVNGRVHRESAAVPGQRLAAEREHLHPLPAEPYVLALGEERLVNEDQTIRFGSVRYSTPPGHAGQRVWCRVHGSELVMVARAGTGLAEIARHLLSTPGNPRICDEHYPASSGRERPAAAPATGPHPRRGGVPGAGRGRRPVADRGRRGRDAADPRQDGPRGRARRGGRRGASIRPSAWRRSPAGSPMMTCPRSWTTWPWHGTAGQVVTADEAHSAQPGTGGLGRAGCRGGDP